MAKCGSHPTQLCSFRWKKEHEAQITALPRVSLERRRGQHSAKALPGPDWVAKTKSTSNHEVLSEASGERPSIKPAQGLTFRAARGKAAPCLVTIPRLSAVEGRFRENMLIPASTHSPLRALFHRGSCVCVWLPLQVAIVTAPRDPCRRVGLWRAGEGWLTSSANSPPLRDRVKDWLLGPPGPPCSFHVHS